MFFSAKEDAIVNGTSVQLVPRHGLTSGAPSLVSAAVSVDGTLRSDGDMQIDGCVKGDVHCVRLVIGKTGSITGEIFAEEVTIRGRSDGLIRAHKVNLRSASKVSGDILHRSLSIELGASFEGNCRPSDDPLTTAL